MEVSVPGLIPLLYLHLPLTFLHVVASHLQSDSLYCSPTGLWALPGQVVDGDKEADYNTWGTE
jgi:hypothetical protein